MAKSQGLVHEKYTQETPFFLWSDPNSGFAFLNERASCFLTQDGSAASADIQQDVSSPASKRLAVLDFAERRPGIETCACQHFEGGTQRKRSNNLSKKSSGSSIDRAIEVPPPTCSTTLSWLKIYETICKVTHNPCLKICVVSSAILSSQLISPHLN